MACEEDLAEVIQNALECSGDLPLLRVQLEERLASLASEQRDLLQRPSSSSEVKKPTMPKEVYLVNELIREYLSQTGFNKTASVLVTESGLPAEPMSSIQLRKVLAPQKKLSNRSRPLISVMVDHLQKK